MSTPYPAALDDSSSLPNPGTGNAPNSPSHAGLHTNVQDGLKAVEAKLGTGSSTPANNFFLVGTGVGSSAWTKAVPTGAVVGTTDSQALTNKTWTGGTITGATISNPTLTVDAVTGYSSANSGSVYGISVSSSQLSASSLTDGTLTPAKLTTGTGSSWALQTWAPTFTNLSGGTLNYSQYIQIGKMVYLRLKYTLAGAGISGLPTFTLPVTASANEVVAAQPHFACLYTDTGTNSFNGYADINSTTTSRLLIFSASGSYQIATGVSSTVPFTWGNTDTVVLSGWYEAA